MRLVQFQNVRGVGSSFAENAGLLYDQGTVQSGPGQTDIAANVEGQAPNFWDCLLTPNAPGCQTTNFWNQLGSTVGGIGQGVLVGQARQWEDDLAPDAPNTPPAPGAGQPSPTPEPDDARQKELVFLGVAGLLVGGAVLLNMKRKRR